MKKFNYNLLLLLLMLVGGEAAAQNNLKVISYNILEGMVRDTTKGKEVFAEWVKSQNPDIMALQECNRFTQVTLEELAHSYGHPYAVLLREKGYPVALTSKYPIVNVSKVTDNMHHGFITARIKDMNVVVLHFSPHKYKKRRGSGGGLEYDCSLPFNGKMGGHGRFQFRISAG